MSAQTKQVQSQGGSDTASTSRVSNTASTSSKSSTPVSRSATSTKEPSTSTRTVAPSNKVTRQTQPPTEQQTQEDMAVTLSFSILITGPAPCQLIPPLPAS